MIERAALIISIPFIYDLEKAEITSNQYTKNSFNLDSFLPYTNNIFNSKDKKDPPFWFNVTNSELEYITITKEFTKTKKLTLKFIPVISAYFFKKNLGILSITLKNFINNQIQNNQFDHYEILAFLNNNLSILDEAWENGITVKQKFKYTDTELILNSQTWIKSYLSPFKDEINTERILQRTKAYTYIICDDNDPKLNNNFIDSILSQKNYYRNHENTFDTYDLASIKNDNVILYSSESSTIILGYYDNSHFMNKTFFEVYTQHYFQIYQIVLYQKTILEDLIYQSSLVDTYNDKNIMIDYEDTIRLLKMDILFYLTKIDYTNISSNGLRNKFYKFIRKINNIKDMQHEAHDVIYKINSELDYIKQIRENEEKTALQEKLDQNNNKFTKIGIFVGLASIPYKDIYEFFILVYDKIKTHILLILSNINT